MQLKSFTRPVILWSLLGLLFLTVLIAVFIFGLPWRWAMNQRIAAIHAKGEPVCLLDLKPKAIPDSENGVHLLQSLWRDIEISQGKLWREGYGSNDLITKEDIAAIRFKLGLSSMVPSGTRAHSLPSVFNYLREVQNLLAQHPDLLERWEVALAKPNFQFPVDCDHGPVQFYKFAGQSILSVNRSAHLLDLLSLYYVVIDDRQKAQRCRLALLQLGRVFDQSLDPVWLGSGIPRISYNSFQSQFSLMSEFEIIQVQNASDAIKPLVTKSPQHLLRGRAVELDGLQASREEFTVFFGSPKTYRPPPEMSREQSSITDHVREFFYQNTAWHHLDALRFIDELQDIIDGATPPETQSYLLKGLNLWSLIDRIEDARLRQFRLALELERLQRHEGRYPADLKGISLPSLDAYGKPMTYEVFENGKAARLTLQEWGIPHPFYLGKIPDKGKP